MNVRPSFMSLSVRLGFSTSFKNNVITHVYFKIVVKMPQAVVKHGLLYVK